MDIPTPSSLANVASTISAGNFASNMATTVTGGLGSITNGIAGMPSPNSLLNAAAGSLTGGLTAAAGGLAGGLAGAAAGAARAGRGAVG